ncbi:hypothetical protein VF_A0012 [Aliivibrio fischeri ES114]|uniref:Uncharacterized protein n=1 Tax=Aliivibrio fischeri (strain ATCC 700601 / ES114) TaxID=312309 RepID=Q5E1L4_ALIF1|nr:hypothetical protein VF_A0012 [Aliivibrio fischeri ES114]MUJ19908.1 hypothetical protein [Aliivibrio fischeri]MUJ28207.1 hypothetical protein [Aliivibrio fischeri]MUK39458.1 hypothetical protein [Aliivibrio fischeri]MUK92894.1 hypothetical protein [Aliivibrio fischeri]
MFMNDTALNSIVLTQTKLAKKDDFTRYIGSLLNAIYHFVICFPVAHEQNEKSNLAFDSLHEIYNVNSRKPS